MCSGEVDGAVEVNVSNDAVTDDISFVQSTMFASEPTNDCSSLSVGGSTPFSTSLSQFVKLLLAF